MKILGFILSLCLLCPLAYSHITPQAAALPMGHPSPTLPAFNHKDDAIQQLNEAVALYKKFLTQPWPRIRTKTPIKINQKRKAIPIIRHRLILLKDLSSYYQSNSKVFDKSLQHGIRIFQWRHGLPVNGIITRSTLRAINVSPKKRLTSLQSALKRWENFPVNPGKQYIVVNIPDYRLNIIEQGRKIINMKVIVGKRSRHTPELYSKIKTIVFNPSWNIPKRIAKEYVARNMLKNPNFLQEKNMQLYSSWRKNADQYDPEDIDWHHYAKHGNRDVYITQAPGAYNALGKVKFLFLNKYQVYLHDTPQKGLFRKIQRAYSSGCVRLQQPYRLVEYLLKNNKNWHNGKIRQVTRLGRTLYVSVKNPIPLYIVYVTAWVGDDGFVHFREDIYRKDHKRVKKITPLK